MKGLKILGIVLFFLMLFFLALSVGVISVTPWEAVRVIFDHLCSISGGNIAGDVIWYLRLPRFLGALLAGAGLAITGVVMQAVVRNPLADPYILGVSAGAGLGATAAVALHISQFLGQNSMGVFAFIGALFAALFILFTTAKSRAQDSLHLLLVGIAVNIICSSFLSLFVAIGADREGIQTITYWLMGSLLQISWAGILALAMAVLFVLAFFMTQVRILDLMLFDDELALTMGARLSHYRQLYLIITALLVGLIVYHTELIGFVGLVVPHIARHLLQSGSHAPVLLLSAACGALFLAWADVLGRAIIPGMDIPIGIVAAIFGAPIFIVLLASRRYGFRS